MTMFLFFSRDAFEPHGFCKSALTVFQSKRNHQVDIFVGGKNAPERLRRAPRILQHVAASRLCNAGFSQTAQAGSSHEPVASEAAGRLTGVSPTSKSNQDQLSQRGWAKGQRLCPSAKRSQLLIAPRCWPKATTD